MMTLAQLSKAIGAHYFGVDMPLPSVSIDSRTLKAGDLFIAVKGENMDGHAYAEKAVKAGAAAIMTDHRLDLGVPEIVVKDTLLGLGALAHAWRKQFTIPIVGLTGSYGKTGTKEMIAAILSQKAPTLSTHGNYNNAYGVPLTLLGLRPEHKFAVIEMGTNSKGEIAYVTKIAEPTLCLITNIGACHLEGLGSLEGVSNEKSDIFLGLPSNGIAVVNSDEPFVESWSLKIDKRHRVSYGLNHKADVMAEHVHFGPEGATFDLITPIGKQSIAVPLLGEHVVYNALAAATAALAAGADIQHVAKGLSLVSPVKGRFKPHTLPDGTILIDDTYNASFDAVENAIKTLSHFTGKKIFVMSNMRELGQYAAEYHSKMGHLVKDSAIDLFFLFGEKHLIDHTLEACGEKARYFASKAELCAALIPECGPNTMVLVKGSRSNTMEDIVNTLLGETKACGSH
ncbi:MAG: UDP-N-acetylmuramoyl-tripeptide--D-alanyl-D-alanine ligase [Gammaproteobacteria bacterium]|nr:UDP-N-acetylmuramoyl-tripeptide--D-alanyl-D-alanine ligase [Gammaproteobacteria bacterium]